MRPRLKYQNLQQTNIGGGVVLPCLEDYNISVQLRPLVCLFYPKYFVKWKEIDKATIEKCPIQELIGGKSTHVFPKQF